MILTNMNSVITEIDNFYLKMVNDYKYSWTLTSFQREEFLSEIKKKHFANGIVFSVDSKDDYSPSNSRITFHITPWIVNDFGDVRDVYGTGTYPLELRIGNNIFIKYDPRNLDIKKDYENSKLLTPPVIKSLSKNEKYKFVGKIVNCTCIYYPNKEYFFSITGGESYSVTKKNISFIATTCYGNYYSPEVMLIKQFKDEKLQNTFIGRTFVNFCDYLSPVFATLISKSSILEKAVRLFFLQPIINILERKMINRQI